MRLILIGLYGDWLLLDDRIEAVSKEIEGISRSEENCANVMTIPGIGPMISTAMVAAIGTGEAFARGRDFAAWVGLVPRQYRWSVGSWPDIIAGQSIFAHAICASCKSDPDAEQQMARFQLWSLVDASCGMLDPKQVGRRSGQ